MNGKNKPTAAETLVEVQNTPELNSITCYHCDGKGECNCDICAPSSDTDCREEFDTGRQMECTCKICLGLGRLNPDGTPLIDDDEEKTY